MALPSEFRLASGSSHSWGSTLCLTQLSGEGLFTAHTPGTVLQLQEDTDNTPQSLWTLPAYFAQDGELGG